MLRKRCARTAAAGFLLFAAVQTQAARDPDPLFDDTAVVEVRLVAPLSEIMKQRSTEDEFDGQLHYTDAGGASTSFDVKVSARGRFRLQKSVCPFAPLRLNFRKSQTKGTLFRKQDKLKLVTHCKGKSKSYEQLMLREYVAYRILNQLTERSFRVRLLRITYEDADGPQSPFTMYGFFVEHKDRLAKRLGLDAMEVPLVRVDDLEPRHLNLISVFHYLIGNTDFSPIRGSKEDCCHNQALVGKGGELAYSVPYDFDQSGIVNAGYAAANPRFKLSSVRQRLYRGRCANNPLLDDTLTLVRQQRDEILALTDEQVGLSKSSRKAMKNYIDLFYRDTDTPEKVERRLVRKCI